MSVRAEVTRRARRLRDGCTDSSGEWRRCGRSLFLQREKRAHWPPMEQFFILSECLDANAAVGCSIMWNCKEPYP